MVWNQLATYRLLLHILLQKQIDDAKNGGIEIEALKVIMLKR